MNEGWRARKVMTDPYLNHVKRICGQHIIGEADFENDAARATDLQVLCIGDVRIGVRLRKVTLLAKHPEWADEITIRGKVPGEPWDSELDKIMAGWGDYFFYGWMDGIQRHVLHWTLGRLDVFREWVAGWQGVQPGTVPGRLFHNGAGDNDFWAFSLVTPPTGWFCIPEEFTVAHEPYSPVQRLRQRKAPKAPRRFYATGEGQGAFFLG